MSNNTFETKDFLLPSLAVLLFLVGIFTSFASVNLVVTNVGFSLFQLVTQGNDVEALAQFISNDQSLNLVDAMPFYLLLFVFVGYAVSCHFDRDYRAALLLFGIMAVVFGAMSASDPIFNFIYENNLYSLGAYAIFASIIVLFVHSVRRTLEIQPAVS